MQTASAEEPITSEGSSKLNEILQAVKKILFHRLRSEDA